MYYILNFQPNPNMSAAEFWMSIIDKMISGEECLIIKKGQEMYIADSFEREEIPLGENRYYNIVIKNQQLKQVFREKDVIYIKYRDYTLKSCLSEISGKYAELMTSAVKGYKRKNRVRGLLKIPVNYPQTDEANQKLKSLTDEKMKKFHNAEGDAVLPLTNGIEYSELSSSQGSKDTQGKEIKEFFNDLLDISACGLNIPPDLLKGNVADTKTAMPNFLALCINPMARYIEAAFNRKLYRQEDLQARSYMKIDTSNIKAVEIKDIAGSIDILTRNGAYTIDDSLSELGLEPIGGKIGSQRFITKNLQPIEAMVNKYVKGGEENELRKRSKRN